MDDYDCPIRSYDLVRAWWWSAPSFDAGITQLNRVRITEMMREVKSAYIWVSEFRVVGRGGFAVCDAYGNLDMCCGLDHIFEEYGAELVRGKEPFIRVRLVKSHRD